MGFWYFLILFLGLFFIFKGLYPKKASLKKSWFYHRWNNMYLNLYFYVYTRKCGSHFSFIELE